jgi:hypothetical protein
VVPEKPDYVKFKMIATSELGLIARAAGDLEAAEKWMTKALAGFEAKLWNRQ